MPLIQAEEHGKIVLTGESLMEMPEFTARNGFDKDKALAREMLRISRETRVLLGQFFMYTALTRSKNFGDACDASIGRDGVHIVIGSLMRTLVVSSAALFDQDPATSNIPKVVKGALQPHQLVHLRRYHSEVGDPKRAELSHQRLIAYRRKIRSGRLREAIEGLIYVRKTSIAHFDANPVPPPNGRKTIIRDFDLVMASAAVIVGEANYFVLGREVDYAGLRKLLRQQADGLCSSLLAGWSSSAT